MKGVYNQRGKGPEGREVSSHGDDDQIPEGPQDLGKTRLGCFLSTSSLSRVFRLALSICGFLNMLFRVYVQGTILWIILPVHIKLASKLANSIHSACALIVLLVETVHFLRLCPYYNCLHLFTPFPLPCQRIKVVPPLPPQK